MLKEFLPLQVAINGRFLGRKMTGVDRVAFEIVSAIDTLIDSKDKGVQNLQFTILTPPGVTPKNCFLHIPCMSVGNHHGQLWEQWDLPRAVPHDTLLLNMCNSAPFWQPRQLVIIHDVATVRVPESYSLGFRVWYRLLIPILYRLSRSICTVSYFSRGELQEIYGTRDNVAVLPEGSEHILRHDADKRILDAHGLINRPYILAVSSLSPHKNFSVLISAIQLMGDRGFDVVIAGGQDPKVFAGSVTDVPSFVKYVGYVSDAELRALYENAMCFVFPSLYEGYGLPPTEAMACGCPVIASNAASIPEICSDAALYFDPNDPSSLATVLLGVTTNSHLQQQLRVNGLAKSATMSWHNAAVALLNEIRRVT